MKMFLTSSLAALLLTFAPGVFAASNGDTTTDASTVCSPSSNSCVTTYTVMIFINGQWVVQYITTVTRVWRSVQQ